MNSKEGRKQLKLKRLKPEDLLNVLLLLVDNMNGC